VLSFLLAGALLLQGFAGDENHSRSDTHVGGGSVLAKFQARKDRRGLFIIRISMSGRTFKAAIDTGSTYTLVDASLRPLLGGPLRRTTLQSPSGKVRAEPFRSPEILVEGLPPLVPTDGVLARDMSRYSRYSAEAFQVILGMDVLSQCVLRIDGTRGVVTFLKDVSDVASKPVAVRRVGGTPWVLGMMGAGSGAWFQLDTGAAGGSNGSISREGFAALSRAGLLDVDGFALQLSVGGTSKVQRGRLVVPLRIGAYELPRAAFSEADYCCLGLGFFERLVTTFDFPNNVVYFEVPPTTGEAEKGVSESAGESRR
jgi:hypothetical protein